MTEKFEFSDFIWGKEIGEGSYGTVVQASLKEGKGTGVFKSIPIPENFGIKRLSKQFIQKENMVQKRRNGRDILAQVMNERNLLRKLNSPFIVPLFGTFQTQAELFYVLSYENSGDLRMVLNKLGALDVKCIRFIMAEVFSALFYLHKNDIIHRDMKPENVLLNESSLGIHSKLCDFATAKDVSDREQKRAFSFVGSAEYISPELLGDGVNEKYSCFESDLWAAGGICYFMLSGLPPFHSDGEYLTFRKVEKLDFSYPEGFHEIGKELISSLLVKNPTERLGANKKNHDIKSHGFFEGIEWETLTKQKSPPLESYQMVLSPESEYSGIFDNEALSRILADESYDLQISSVDDESCHGIPSLLENSKYESLVKDQRLNKSNIANRWNSFVNGELILKLGYVLKLKGLFLEKRMMLLTGGRKDNPPKIIFIDADSWEKVGSINITKETEINPLSVARFTIINGEKKFDLIEKNSFIGSLDGAFQWVTKLKKVQLQYFK